MITGCNLDSRFGFPSCQTWTKVIRRFWNASVFEQDVTSVKSNMLSWRRGRLAVRTAGANREWPSNDRRPPLELNHSTRHFDSSPVVTRFIDNWLKDVCSSIVISISAATLKELEKRRMVWGSMFHFFEIHQAVTFGQNPAKQLIWYKNGTYPMIRALTIPTAFFRILGPIRTRDSEG